MQELLHMGDSGTHLASRGQEDSNGDYEDEDDDPSTAPIGMLLSGKSHRDWANLPDVS
jgi:hypothetical protein